MSALAPPPFIAPAKASVPQGSTGGSDATGFKGLLDACLDKDAAPVDAEKPDAAPANDETDVAATTGFLVSPSLVPAPAVPAPVVPGSVVPEPAVPTSVVPEAVPPAPVGPAPEAPDTDSSAPAAAAPADSAGKAPTNDAPPAIDPSLLSQGSGVQPPAVQHEMAPQQVSAAPQETEAPAKPAATVAPPAPAPDTPSPASIAETTETKAAAAATAVLPPAPQPAPAPAPQVPPAPMRALAERTSRPLDPPADEATDASAAASGVSDNRAGTASASAASASQSTPDPTARPFEAATAATDIPSGSDERPVEAAPAGENPTSSTSNAAHVRETSLSGLSRATIDATAQIAAQILRKLEGRSTRFEMALTPDDLGRVDVKLDIDSEGRLAARLAFDNPAAATDLRGRVDDLRRELEDAGFHLADDAFEFAERDSGSSSFDRGQDARQGQNRAFAAASRLNAEIDVAQPPRWMALSLSPSGVDLKV